MTSGPINKFLLHKDNAVLVIVDIQEKLAAVMGEREKVVSNCLHLIEASNLLRFPLILTEQYPKGLGPTIGEIREAIASYEPVEKMTFSCCDEPVFSKEVSALGKKTVLLAGMESHVCVLQTCIGLLKEGYMVHVVNDAICSRKKGDFKTGISFMRDAGAVITSTETALFQLLHRAGTEEFRVISRSIK